MFLPEKKSCRFRFLAVFGLAACLLLGAGFASHATIQDRRVTVEMAQAMAEKARKATNFPIVVNDLVLEQLNVFLGTPKGRQFVADSTVRMVRYEEAIRHAIANYELPRELLAIPFVESGYRNLPPNKNPRHGAGLWMFIKPTAINYGLQVDADRDERLDVDLETDAAMRYLSSLNLRFRDWHLAILAYNAGERRVQTGINEHGTRDAFDLIRLGVENDSHYLARVMAVILILANPDRLP